MSKQIGILFFVSNDGEKKRRSFEERLVSAWCFLADAI